MANNALEAISDEDLFDEFNRRIKNGDIPVTIDSERGCGIAELTKLDFDYCKSILTIVVENIRVDEL